MIPKKIHYCWFGNGKKNQLIEECLRSWKKYCPDYEIIEWNESNYSTENAYFRQALEANKWAFAADYARLDVVYKFGGIYLDTDVELIRSLDSLLGHDCFLGTEVSKNGYLINTGVGFGASKHNSIVKLMLDEYADIKFKISQDNYDCTPCPERNTKPFLERGYIYKNEIQDFLGAQVYPVEYFSPKNYLTRKIEMSNNTFSIHHYDGAWMPKKSKIRLKIKEAIGPNLMRLFYKIRGIEFK